MALMPLNQFKYRPWGHGSSGSIQNGIVISTNYDHDYDYVYDHDQDQDYDYALWVCGFNYSTHLYRGHRCGENSHTRFFSALFWRNQALGFFRPALVIHKHGIPRFICILLVIHTGCELCLRITLWWRVRMSCIILQALHHLQLTGISLCFPPVPLCNVGKVQVKRPEPGHSNLLGWIYEDAQ